VAGAIAPQVGGDRYDYLLLQALAR
jgi:hypothetical protein